MDGSGKSSRMRQALAAMLPPIAIVGAFFLPLGGLAAPGRSVLVLGAFAIAGAIAGGPRPLRDAALVACPGIVVGLLLTLAGAMEPLHLVYGVAMAGAGSAVCIGAAWSIAARRRQVA